MKRIISILLILVTVFYVLPVSDGFTADTETTCKYADKSTDDGKDTKKDNGKEFIPAALILASNKNCSADNSIRPLLAALPVHFTVETPPPDKA
jgi:hypothetical protein